MTPIVSKYGLANNIINLRDSFIFPHSISRGRVKSPSSDKALRYDRDLKLDSNYTHVRILTKLEYLETLTDIILPKLVSNG